MNSVAGDRLLVERVVASEDRIAEAAADVLPLDVGRVVRQRQYPHVFDANLVRHPRLERATLDRTLARLEAPLREIGAHHLQICADLASVGETVGAELRRRGFVRDRLLVMALVAPTARAPVPGIEVLAAPTEAPLSAYAETMDRMSREEPWYTPALAHEIVGSLESKAAVGALVLHVARIGARNVGAIGLSVGEGRSARTAAIVNVGTIPEARGRGVAQTMVLRLVEKARAQGCDLVYLVARADDTPKDLYRKVGFEVVHPFDVWLRPPSA